MKKKIQFGSILTFSIILTGCFGGSGTESGGERSLQTIEDISIQIPLQWNKILKEDFANTIPKETIAIFVNKTEESDFIQNVNIVKESLNTDASSIEYAKANIILGSKALVDYRNIGSEEIELSNKKTVLHSFRARSSTTEPMRFYEQSYLSNNNIGYTITCISEDENTDQQTVCSEIIKSIQLQ